MGIDRAESAQYRSRLVGSTYFGGFRVTKVVVRQDELIERAIKRFKRIVEQAGILREVRRREHYVKPSVEERMKSRAAASRNRKREKRAVLQDKGPF
jgi:small subunit ribosomal protein S21